MTPIESAKNALAESELDQYEPNANDELLAFITHAEELENKISELTASLDVTASELEAYRVAFDEEQNRSSQMKSALDLEQSRNKELERQLAEAKGAERDLCKLRDGLEQALGIQMGPVCTLDWRMIAEVIALKSNGGSK